MKTFLTILPIILLLNFVFCILLVLKNISKNEKLSNQKKTLWYLVIFFIPFIGSIVYLLDSENSKK